MNFEERMEALARRHEAMTMNLELLSHEREKDNERIQAVEARLEADFEKLTEQAKLHTERIEGLIAAAESHSRMLEMDGEHIRALARISERHERRLTGLEDGVQ